MFRDKITDTELEALSVSRFLRNVTKINLSKVKTFTSFGLMQLVNSPNVCYVNSIDLSYTSIDDSGAIAIANSENLKSLQHLTITESCKLR